MTFNLNFKNQDFITASKAVLTVFLTLLATYRFAAPMALYFALYTACCCALMQAGETKLKQLLSMILAGAAFLFFLGLGLMIKEHFILANIALVIFAFITFYLPNLGIVYKLPPVLGLIFYVFVISMPTQGVSFSLTLLASLIGVLIAIAIYFLFWPYEVKHELTLLAQTLTHQYRTLLERYYLILRSSRTSTRKNQLEQGHDDLGAITTLLTLYEKLSEEANPKKVDVNYFDTLYLKLYSLLQINTMIAERFPHLPVDKRPLAQQLLRDLISQSKDIEYRFDKMVPHSFIAKNLIGRSLQIGKILTRPLLPIRAQSKKAPLTDEEFNKLLTQLISDKAAGDAKRFAFGLLRLRELLQQLHAHQSEIHLSFQKKILFL